jgi:small subunit ribosomal protein S9
MATKLTKKTSTPIKPKKREPSKPAASDRGKSSPKMVTPKQYTYAVGRRRSATARVRLFKGKQDILINGKLASEYWPSKNQQSLFQVPFVLTKTLGQYSATAKIKGSGSMGQIGAFTHGLSRAFNKLDKDKYRPALKEAGLLTRDSRMKETRKVGQGGKARHKKQSPKR